MRYFLRWPTTPADCDYWTQQTDTDGPGEVAGTVDNYAVRVAPLRGESPLARFQRATDRLWSYDIFPPGLMRPTVCSEDGRVKLGAVIVQRVRLGLVVIEAAVRVIDVWTTEAEDAAGFTYVTLAGHPEMGVSSFWVSRIGDEVGFRIKARSRPGTLLTRIGRPVSRYFQRAATRAALRHFASRTPDERVRAMRDSPRPMPWPHLYRVTLGGIKGEVKIETVLSWLGEHKAVAMAVEAHGSGWLGPKKTWPVYAVEVEDLGLAPKDRHGMVGSGPRGTLEDRSEF